MEEERKKKKGIKRGCKGTMNTLIFELLKV